MHNSSYKHPSIACSLGHQCAACSQYDAAVDRVRQLKTALREAKREATRLATVKNSVHDSMNKLPSEVVSRIMEVFYGDDSELVGRQTKIFSPFKFGAVSHSWRQIAWTTPQLWSSVHFILNNKRNMTRRIELCKQYVARSGALPLTIEVECEDEDTFDIDKEKSGAIVDMLLSWVKRWYTVKLQFTSDMYNYMNARLPFPCTSTLQTLYVGSIDPEDDFDDELLPMNWSFITGALKTLIFEDTFELCYLTVDCTHLVDVRGRGSVGSLSCYLRASPRLQISRMEIGEGVGGDFFGQPFIHDSLYLLDLDFSDSDEAESILLNLTCPNLEDLSTNYYDNCLQPDDMHHFLLRSPKLQHLTLTCFPWTISDFQQILPSLPRLETLVICSVTSTFMSQLLTTALSDPTSPFRSLLSTSLSRLEFKDPIPETSWNWDFLLHIDKKIAIRDEKDDSLLGQLNLRPLKIVIILGGKTHGYLRYPHRQAMWRMKNVGVVISIYMDDEGIIRDDWETFAGELG